jgi:glycine oxidase
VGRPLPVGPVRGQILALAPPPPLPRPIVWGAEAYLVPRADGSVVAGATEEEAGFDARVTVDGLAGLLASVPRLMPGWSGATFRRAWAGLRPATPDRRPVLGPVAGAPGLFLATGHFRNGVLLSAVTGELLAECVLRAPPLELEAFAVERFAAGG